MKNHVPTKSRRTGISRLSQTVNFALASLSGQSNAPIGVAACSFDIQLDEPWQQILPSSDFAAYDGRPHEVPGNKWRIDNERGEALATMLNARVEAGQELLFDYEHQTLLTKENGQKAPASAWGEKFAWKPGQGLFAQLRFTDTARAHIKAQEYRFYSPVVIYDKTNGDVLDIHSVALTNDPAVKGMASAAALTTQVNQQTEPTPMNPALELLLGLLGINLADGETIDAASLHARLTTASAGEAITALKAKLDEAESTNTELAALRAEHGAGEGAPNPAEYVPVATYNAVVNELAALTANHESVTVDQVIEQAKADGKFITQSEMPYLQSLGNKDIASLKAQLDARPAIAALKGKQTNEQRKPDDVDNKGVAALTADEKLVADQLGISHEDFAATK